MRRMPVARRMGECFVRRSGERRAADIQVQLVERLAEEDAQHRTSAPRSAQRATGVSAAKERGSARSWAGGA